MTIALAVVKALSEMHIEDVSIKWPNDVLIRDKKVCGILTELNFLGKKINYVVVGVGLNVHTSESDWPAHATSLEAATGRKFDLGDLAPIMMKRIDDYYNLLLEKKFSDIIKEVREFSGLILGGRVKVSWEDREIEGYARDFDEDGHLVIRLDNGFLSKVSSGHLEKL